jgi:glycosyltransferase involved in cell wall biosynthesis
LQRKHKILIVGQTPPPYHGQAIMIEKILDFKYDDIVFSHVRMNFSADIDDIGRVQVKKLFELLRVIFQIYIHRIFYGIRILYYPPAGPDKVPIVRDILILVCTRFLFRRTIFHFHAGGLSNAYSALSPLLQRAFRAAYFHPDLSICLSSLNPADGEFIQSKNNRVVAYGIDEQEIRDSPGYAEKSSIVHILFVGAMKESKGVNDLITATSNLVREGNTNILVSLMGKFDSSSYEQEIEMMIENLGLSPYVRLLGVKSGKEKFFYFKHCDIFCFPSFYESETFGIVLLEAMQMAKPIVTTKWRGIPDVVQHEVNGFLVEINNAGEISKSLGKLIENSALREQFGRMGLNLYREKFTSEIFRKNFYNAIKGCLN